ncbi:MAG: GNAT family N-acetyltransferase [Actinobacteria bacterium]|nr:GNAT family N-acetyltransferase [Actinomycetota bacterium]
MPFAPDWPLETERLLLRPYREDDFALLYAMQSDADVVRWLYEEPRDEEEARALLGRKIAGTELAAEDDWLSAVVTLRATGEAVGDVAFHWVSVEHRTGEIGYMFHPAHQGRGYATEAARPLLDFAFGEMRLHRVIGRTEARNLGSARVLEKLGMRLEAHLVENEFVKGEWQSELVYAVLAGEWVGAAG